MYASFDVEMHKYFKVKQQSKLLNALFVSKLFLNMWFDPTNNVNNSILMFLFATHRIINHVENIHYVMHKKYFITNYANRIGDMF